MSESRADTIDPRDTRRTDLVWMGVIGSVLLALSVVGTTAGDLGTKISVFLPVALCGFGLYFVASAVGLRAKDDRKLWILMIGFAIAFRVVWLFATPSLSDDIYRSVWEGRVILAGVNPYSHAPSDPELVQLNTMLLERVAHREIPAIYPPISQFFSAACCLLSGSSIGVSVWLLKAVYTTFDFLTGLLIARWLLQTGKSRLGAIAWFWNPLVVLEFSGQGHNDAIAIFFWVLAGIRLSEKRTLASAAALALCTASKWFGVLALPLILVRARGRRLWLSLFTFCAILVAFWIPFLYGLSTPKNALLQYGANWEYNSPCYSGLASALRSASEALGDSMFVSGSILAPSGSLDAARVARLLLMVGLAALCVWTAFRKNTERAFGGLTLGALLLSPTIHPWYVIWTIPFVVIADCFAAFVLSATVIVTYGALIPWRSHGTWVLDPWLMWLEWLPFGAALIWSFLRKRTR